MATLPRRNSGLRGGIAGGTPRGPRHSTGSGPPSSTFGSSRDQATNSTPRATGAWGTGGVGSGSRVSERSSPARPAGGDAYKVACRDRWIDVTRTMMGQKAEITTTDGCTYEGVFHVLTPAEPAPGSTGGLYKVRVMPLVCRNVLS